MSFSALLVLILMIAATAFTTRFSELDENFIDIWHSARYLFDIMVSNYDYVDYDVYNRSYSIFLMIYMFFTGIFLLNFLVAIIETIYEYMLEVSKFQAKKYRYLFYNT